MSQIYRYFNSLTIQWMVNGLYSNMNLWRFLLLAVEWIGLKKLILLHLIFHHSKKNQKWEIRSAATALAVFPSPFSLFLSD